MILKEDILQLQLIDVLEFKSDNFDTVRTNARSFCALSLRTDGQTKIILKNQTIRLSAKDLVFFPPNLSYIRQAKNDKMIVFHFYITGYTGYELEVIKNFDYESMLTLFKEALFEWQQKKAGYYFRASALLYLIFAKLRAFFGDEVQNISPQILPVIDYISKNYAISNLSIQNLAKKVHMSETYFRRVFKRDIGVSPKTYLNDLRLERAQSLLNAGYDSVAAIAEKSGFSDSKNFATAFKKKFGYPPSAQKYSF